MAEVIGLVAASGQFVEQSIKIVKLSKKFCDKFNDAPKELKRWQEEVTSLSKIVDRIQNTPALQIDDLKPMIDQCASASEELLEIFRAIEFNASDSFSHRSWRTTVALSKEDDIRDLFARIERLKSNLSIQLSIIQINQNEEGFARVTSVMQEMKVSFGSGTDEEQCIQALFLIDPVGDREEVITKKGHRTSGTCEWILKTKEYEDWNAARTGLLWIAGPPGKGKTFISIFLSQRLETSEPDATVIWFFCDNKSDYRDNATGILRGLMIQLVMKHNYLIRLLLSAWKVQRATIFSTGSFETLWAIFLSMLKALRNQQVCCIIDGLDECVGSSISLLLFKLKTLFQHPSDLNAQLSSKFIIASRENPQIISETLSTFPRITLDDLKDDINLYIADRVAHLATVKNIRNTTLQFEIEAALRKGAEGTFLWVSFMSQDLENKTVNEIEDALLHVPQGLYPLYRRIINQIQPETRQVVSDMLTWILFARRPLTISELTDAIQVKGTKALRPEKVCLGHVQACGHLLQRYYKGTDEKDIISRKVKRKKTSLFVTFVHQSAKDFLLSTALDCFILRPAINPKQGHATIVDRLIRLLCENLNDGHIAGSEARYRSPCLSYAIDHWEFHIAELEEDCKEVLDKHMAFFGNESKPRDYLWWQRQKEPYPKRIYPPPHVPFLHMACDSGLYHLVEAWLLPRDPFTRLRRKRKINQKWGGIEQTPLHIAVRRLQKETVRVLLRHGADASIRDTFSETPIFVVVCGWLPIGRNRTQVEDVYHILASSKTGTAVLKKEANQFIRFRGETQDTSLLHVAVVRGYGSICQDLTERIHYDTQLKISAGGTPLHLALKKRISHIAHLLVTQCGASLHPQIELLRAIVDSEHGEEPLESLFEMFAYDWCCDINTTDDFGNTIFHYPAFGYDDLQAIQTCQITIDWDKRNDNGQTFLHSNIEWLKDDRLLVLFLTHSVWDMNTTDHHGRTPLHSVFLQVQQYCRPFLQHSNRQLEDEQLEDEWLAVEISQMEYVDIQTLLDLGADPSLADKNGVTASDLVMSLLGQIPAGSLSFHYLRLWAEGTITILGR